MTDGKFEERELQITKKLDAPGHVVWQALGKTPTGDSLVGAGGFYNHCSYPASRQ